MEPENMGKEIPVVTVERGVELGPVKIMNAVNNGPKMKPSDQTRGNFDEYAALEIPYARIHDAAHCHSYGGCHTVDISCIFPDFSRDADDGSAYDFALTDEYLSTMRAAGTEPFFRLGQSIEHWKRKYGVNPPADFDKWASVCEHVVRHFNDGWADGHHWNIRYWEIWNEPDLGPRADGRPSPTWTGTKEQFFRLYSTTALRLKSAHPGLMIGGPALAGCYGWTDDFLDHVKENGIPLDFFSWHKYAVSPEDIAECCRWVAGRLAGHGFDKTESILNEWNYVRGWTEEWVYSLRVESGDLSYKGAAFIASVMSICQRMPLDMLMFYDARVDCAMNNLFDFLTMEPMRAYYPFFAWARLRRLGTEVGLAVENAKDIYGTAAISGDGHLGMLLTRYNDDDNVSAPVNVSVRLPGFKAGALSCHVTDETRMFTQVPLSLRDGGEFSLSMKPNSFAYIEA